MGKIKPSEIHVAYNDELGIVFHAKKGKIKSTTAEHAKIFSDALAEYHNGALPYDDCTALEEYMEKSFGIYPSRNYAFEATDLSNITTLNKLEIMIATDCNLNCKYCYADGGHYGRKSDVMQPDQAVMYLDKLVKGRYSQVDEVFFFGGEPTVQPDTIETVCIYFKQLCDEGLLNSLPNYTMVSNGTLIDKKMAHIIASYEIRVTISIDGPKDVNDKLRITNEGSGTYEDIINGISNMINAGSSPKMFEATYTKLHNDMGYSKSAISSFIKNNIYDSPVLIEDCKATTASVNNDLSFKSESKVFEEDEEKDAFLESMIYRNIQYDEYYDISCSAGLSMVTITPDGQLYPCHFFIESNDYTLGTVSDFPNNLLKTTSAVRGTRRSEIDKCKDCWALGLCRSCPAYLLLFDDEELDESHCEDVKKYTSNVLIKIAKMSEEGTLLSYMENLNTLLGSQ